MKLRESSFGKILHIDWKTIKKINLGEPLNICVLSSFTNLSLHFLLLINCSVFRNLLSLLLCTTEREREKFNFFEYLKQKRKTFVNYEICMTVRWRVTKLSPLHFKIEHLYGKWKIIVEVSLIQKDFTLGMDIWVLDPTGRMVDSQPRITQQWHETKQQNLLRKQELPQSILEFSPRIRELTWLAQTIGNREEDLYIDSDSSKKEELIPKSSSQHSSKISAPNFVSHSFNITETWIKKVSKIQKKNLTQTKEKCNFIKIFR